MTWQTARHATWKGIPATGKAVRFPLCAVFTFGADDTISAETVYYDRLTALTERHGPAELVLRRG